MDFRGNANPFGGVRNGSFTTVAREDGEWKLLCFNDSAHIDSPARYAAPARRAGLPAFAVGALAGCFFGVTLLRRLQF